MVNMTEQQVASSTFLKLKALLNEIISYSQKQFTGRLTIDTPQQYQWLLYFGMGRLLWASGGEHPRRRWRRQLARACKQDDLKAHYSQQHLREGDRYECWDFHLLLALHKRKIISADQVKEVMTGMIGEILFDIYRQGFEWCWSEQAYPHQSDHQGQQVFTREWVPSVRPSQELVIPPSWGVETTSYLGASQKYWQQWQKAGLSKVSPNQAPCLRRLKQLQQQISPQVYQTLVSLITGDRSLRDLAMLMKKDTLQIARSLQPYIRDDLISLEVISDLPAPPSSPKQTQQKEQLGRRAQDQAADATTSSSPAQQRPLLAFVDDSEQSRNIMENIITGGGYEFLGISDSVEAIPSLVEKQPQLIFLDLVMPNISGYELCSQIRKISSLREVPIVIVTGNDGIADRMRAKVVGANNFISKPIDRSEVLTLALQYTQSHS